MSNGTAVKAASEESAGAGGIAEILSLVDRLIEDEADPERRKLLGRLRELAAGTAGAYPTPPVGEGLSDEKLDEVHRTLRAVARALGMKDLGDEVPQIGKQISEIKKRIDRLAGIPNEDEGGQGASFKGLL